jgi:riboflavin kinase/FMN adenylyltransferase
MKFESIYTKGKGRGRPMGFPTINLKVPEDFELEEGVYAAKITIENNVFKGALHFGPTPTFNEQEKSLEVYLIGLLESELTKYGLVNMDEKIIEVEILKHLRSIVKFRSVKKLIAQIEEDVKQIKKLI